MCQVWSPRQGRRSARQVLAVRGARTQAWRSCHCRGCLWHADSGGCCGMGSRQLLAMRTALQPWTTLGSQLVSLRRAYWSCLTSHHAHICHCSCTAVVDTLGALPVHSLTFRPAASSALVMKLQRGLRAVYLKRAAQSFVYGPCEATARLRSRTWRPATAPARRLRRVCLCSTARYFGAVIWHKNTNGALG